MWDTNAATPAHCIDRCRQALCDYSGIGFVEWPFSHWLSMIFSENRYPPRTKCGAGFFAMMLWSVVRLVLTTR